MLPIQAQLCTGWKRMAGTNRITVGDGSQGGMDRGRIWIVIEYGWMTGGGRQEMDLRRWIMGDGWQSIHFTFMKILQLCEVIRFMKSRL